jgi:hypothetical protein
MGNMIEMTLEQAETAVETLHGRKFKNWTLDMEWDGWDLVFYTPNSMASMNKNGAFRNGEWVMKNRIAVNERGTYVVSGHNARIFAKTGNRSQ